MDETRGYPLFTPFGEQILIDESRTWVDPNGYRLSDRLWLGKDRDRATIDFILQTGMRTGRPVLDVAKELEEFLTPEGRSSKTRQPTGRGSGNAAARRLARTETSRAFNQASIEAAKANPFVRGLKWNLSGTHKDQDQCDANASGSSSAPGWGPGEYRMDDFPRIPDHPHCRCYVTSVQGDVDHVIDILHSDLHPSDFQQQLEEAREPAPPRPVKPPWVEKVQELAQKHATGKGAGKFGRMSQAQIKTAGKLVRQELLKRQAAQTSEIRASTKALEEELMRAGQAAFKATTPEERERLVAERDEIGRKMGALWRNRTSNGQMVKGLLSEVRSMGSEARHTFFASSDQAAIEAVNSTADLLPTSWTEQSTAYGSLTSNKVERGYYSHSLHADLHVSGLRQADLDDVAMHEFGHRMEAIRSDILTAERDFYHARTKGEALTEVYPGNKKELGRRDRFQDAYIGKDYSNQAYEVLSMGLQDLYGAQKWIMDDPDMLDFILGLLVTH